MAFQTVTLSTLNDDALWKIAREPLPPDQWRRHQRLLHKNEDSALTSAESEELARLRAVTDRFVLRRSYALALLKWVCSESVEDITNLGYNRPNPPVQEFNHV